MYSTSSKCSERHCVYGINIMLNNEYMDKVFPETSLFSTSAGDIMKV